MESNVDEQQAIDLYLAGDFATVVGLLEPNLPALHDVMIGLLCWSLAITGSAERSLQIIDDRIAATDQAPSELLRVRGDILFFGRRAFNETLAAYQASLDTDAEKLGALLGKAACWSFLSHNEDGGAAIDAAEAAASVSVGCPRSTVLAQYCLALATARYRFDGDLEGAVEALGLALTALDLDDRGSLCLDPGLRAMAISEILTASAATLLRLDRPVEAAPLITRRLESDDTDLPSLLIAGSCGALLCDKMYLRYTDRASELYPGDWRVSLLAGMINVSCGNYTEAHHWFEKAESQPDSDHNKLSAWKARVLRQQGNKAAVAAYRDAINDWPRDDDFLASTRLLVLLDAGEPETMLEEIEELRAGNEADRTFDLFELAALFELGRYEDASTRASELLDLEPANQDVSFLRIQALIPIDPKQAVADVHRLPAEIMATAPAKLLHLFCHSFAEDNPARVTELAAELREDELEGDTLAEVGVAEAAALYQLGRFDELLAILEEPGAPPSCANAQSGFEG